MAYTTANVAKITISYIADNQPAKLVAVEFSQCNADVSGGDLTEVQSWVKHGNFDHISAGDEFTGLYVTNSDLSGVTLQALAGQRAGAVCFWRTTTYWSFYD